MEDEANPTVEGEVNELAENVTTEAPATLEEGEVLASEEGETESKPENGGKKNRVQERIDELTRKTYEERKAREAVEERNRQYEAQLAELTRAQTQTQWQQKEPRLEDFDFDHEKWKGAYQQWMGEGIRQQQEAISQAERQRQAQEAEFRKQTEIQRKMVEAQSKYPDFNLKVNSPDLPSLAQMNQAAYEALIDSDAMAEIAYYLASNPSEVYRFKDLTPIRAVKEMAKLEAKLTAGPSKSVSSAPPPPVKATGKTVVTGNPDKMTTKEWMEWRNSQLYSSR